MGRKAKEAAQEKIGIWTNRNSRKKVSTTATTTTTTAAKENANASNNENRSPLQTQTQSDLNKMKNLSVRVERLDAEKLDKILFSPPKPVSAAQAVEKIFKKDKNTDNQNVYDLSFDDGIKLDTVSGTDMKDLFEKMEKENKIVLKKYKAKNVKTAKKPAETKDAVSKAQTQKRRRDKQPTEIEPPRKKPNLRNKNATNALKNAEDSISVTKKRRPTDENLETNNNVRKATNASNSQKEKKNDGHNDSLNFIQLRNRSRLAFQSTPKSSTPLNNMKKPNPIANSTLNNESPVLASITRNALNSLKGKPLRLSLADKSDDQKRAPSVHDDSDHDVPFDNDFDDDVQVFTNTTANTDKENTFGLPSTSAAAKNVPDNSGVILDESENSIQVFSPTKRRVYGNAGLRSPLKNITNEVNNTSGGTFNTLKSMTSTTGSFGAMSVQKSAHLSRSANASNDVSKATNITLPEPQSLYLSVRRPSLQQNHELESFIDVDNCFGFDDDDDDDDFFNQSKPNPISNPISNLSANSKPTTSKQKTPVKKQNVQHAKKKPAISAIRANLKRFLHHVEAADDNSSVTKKPKPTTNAPKALSKAKKLKSPVKEKPKVIFNNTEGTKQKDIRSAFIAKAYDNAKPSTSKDADSIPLFEELETVQDRRKSYSRPAKQYRKRRISIDSEPEEIEDDDEEIDAEKEKSKPKRRKKLVESEQKENPELEEFAKSLNAHFEDVDQFELMVE